MTVSDVISQFQVRSNSVDQYINNAFYQGQDGAYIFDEAFRSFVVESCLIRLYVIWEEFLEECFTCYSMAQPSLSGLVYNRYATPIDREHAKKMAVGNQPYVEWGNPTVVLTLCKIYLENGEPLRSAVASIYQDLLDMRTIRNAAAHLSTTTKKAFESVATRVLGRSCAGITVSNFLLSHHPGGSDSETMFMYYTNVLNAATSLIVR